MKRSEFVAKLDSAESPWVTSVVELAEAAGVKWDPEEEPLPERIAMGGSARLWAYPGGRWLSDKETTEAVRRYNSWPKLRGLIAHHINTGGGPGACTNLSLSLLAILDGKETS